MKIPEINPEEFEILVCDDESSIRTMLGEALNTWGFHVQTAPSGEAALDYIKANGAPHVVLTDIRMGGMTGIQLAEKVKAISEEIEVVIMTSHASFDTAIQAMRLGVYDYLSKPFDDLNNVETVLRHVCTRVYMRFYTEFLLQELEVKNHEISEFALTSEILSDSLDINKVLQASCNRISNAFDDSAVVFMQFRAPESSLNSMFHSEGIQQSALELSIAIEKEKLEEVEKETALVSSLKSSLGLEHCEVHVCFLYTRGVVQGLFAILTDPEQIEWDEAKQNLLNRYVQLVSTNFENALLHAKMIATSIKDGLTGLYNVRHFKERMTLDLKQFERLKQPCSFLFFDVDHFKKFNDTNGHPAGDEVLRIIGRVLRKFFRSTDIIARYGGEEFVVAMPYTSQGQGLIKAEALRKIIEETKFPMEESQPNGKVTVSIGVAEYPSHGADLEHVLKAADDALYEAKKKSRNVVCSANSPEGYVAPFEVS